MSEGCESRQRVLVSLPVRIRFHGEAASGVLDYAESHTAWEVVFEDVEPADRSVGMSVCERYDGVIGSNWHSTQLGGAGWDARPLVVIGDEPGPFPRVVTDNAASGEMAYRHLAERGFQRFAMCGMPGLAFHEQRWESFRGAALQDGRGEDALVAFGGWVTPGMSVGGEDWLGLRGGLEAQSGPVGVLGVTSLHAAEVVRAAQASGDRGGVGGVGYAVDAAGAVAGARGRAAVWLACRRAAGSDDEEAGGWPGNDGATGGDIGPGIDLQGRGGVHGVGGCAAVYP